MLIPRSLRLASGLALLVGSIACGGQTRRPAPVMGWEGADWLERPGRVSEEEPERLLDLLDVEPGATVVDLGAGTGYYARRLARRVGPSGRVIAVDIQPRMLELLEGYARREGIENIETVLGEDGDPSLPNGIADWILLVDVYHEIQAPEAMLERLREVLAPEGRVALVEYRLEGETARHIKVDHRMSVEQVRAEWEPAGFELEDLDESLPAQHLFIFRAAAGSAKPY